ncbi:MAG: hypothetical protein JWO58_1088 [Chitinophagaceae bacterium]|nr:hypothetical protein [Chitinophagaceae bacterium]
MGVNLFTLTAKASISKSQYPKVTKEDIVSVFYNEVKQQHHSVLIRKDGFIEFSIAAFDFGLNRYRNKFGNYSKGYFEIQETSNFISITFHGELLRGLFHAGFIPIALLFVAIGFIGIKAFLFPLILWPLIYGLVLLSENISKTLYLAHKINRIQERLRDGERITE